MKTYRVAGADRVLLLVRLNCWEVAVIDESGGVRF
jgi:hypothetical protein